MTNSIIIDNRNITDLELESWLNARVEVADLQNCGQIGDPTLCHLALKTPIRALRWIANGATTAQGHLFFANHSKTLQSLNVSGSPQFSDKACQSHLSSPLLRALDVSFCPLTDSAFDKICAPLEYLNLQGCRFLTDVTAKRLAEMPTLKHLFLGFNDGFTIKGIQALISRTFQTLKIYNDRI